MRKRMLFFCGLSEQQQACKWRLEFTERHNNTFEPFYKCETKVNVDVKPFYLHSILPQLMRLFLECIFTSVSGMLTSLKVACDAFSNPKKSQWNKVLSFSQSRFQLWRETFSEAEASGFFSSQFYFPFFQVSERASGEISLSPFPLRLKNRVHISNSGTTGQLR